MILHEDKNIFQQVLEDTALYMGLPNAGVAEKDYFVTLMLKKLAHFY